MVILSGLTSIFAATEMLDLPEGFLVSGMLVVIAMFLLEPREEKVNKALHVFLLVISFYGVWFKLPLMLEGRLNYYVIKIVALVLMVIMTVMIFVLQRKLMRRAAPTVR